MFLVYLRANLELTLDIIKVSFLRNLAGGATAFYISLKGGLMKKSLGTLLYLI